MASAQDRSITNALGWADRWGNLSVWFDFDRDLHLDPTGKTQLPIRLHHSSEQRFISEGAAGAGWWFPLLESTVAQMTERTVKLHTVAGSTETLIQDPKDPLLYSTKDLQWKGERRGSRFLVTNHKNWQYEYEGGRLRTAKTPGGDILNWNHSQNKVTSIQSRAHGALLTASHDPETGLIKEIQYNKAERLTFKPGQRPITALLQGQMLVVEEKLMQWTLTEKEKDGAKPQTTKTFQWEPVTGWLRHDGEFRYTVTPRANGDEIFPLIERSNDQGQMESYEMDRTKMVAVHRRLDGSTTAYQYVGTPGPSFGKLRKSTLTTPDGINRVLYQAAYDNAGKVIRLNSGGAFIKTLQIPTLNPAEAVPLIMRFVTQDEEDLNIAGPYNKLVGAVIGGRPYVYFHDEAGKMTGRLHLSDYLKQNPGLQKPETMPAWLVQALAKPIGAAPVDLRPLSLRLNTTNTKP